MEDLNNPGRVAALKVESVDMEGGSAIKLEVMVIRRPEASITTKMGFHQIPEAVRQALQTLVHVTGVFRGVK